MKSIYQRFMLAAMAIASVVSACQRQDAEQPQPKTTAQKRVLSDEEKKRVEHFKQAAQVLEEMIKADKGLVSSLRSGISISRPGQQNVSFEELMKGSNTPSFKGTETFANKFSAIANRIYGQKASRGVSTNDLLSELVADGAQIYFPYDEYFAASNQSYTVAYDPIDNADTSIGYRYNSDNVQEEVIVNDDYTVEHPTIIIMEDDAADIPDDTSFQPMRPSAIGDTVNEIYIGCVKLKKHMDGVFDGNNEVVFVRSDTYIRLNATGQVESGTNGYITKSADISRVNARDKNWVYKTILFEPDWDRTERSEHFAVYEHDPHQTRTQRTSTSLALNVPRVGTVNQSVENTLTYSTDHRLYGSQNYGRTQFFNTNTIPLLGGSLKDGYRIYNDDVLEYTYPRRTLIFR